MRRRFTTCAARSSCRMLIAEQRPGKYFWMSPPGNAGAVDAVYVDRVYLTRAAPVDSK